MRAAPSGPRRPRALGTPGVAGKPLLAGSPRTASIPEQVLSSVVLSVRKPRSSCWHLPASEPAGPLLLGFGIHFLDLDTKTQNMTFFPPRGTDGKEAAELTIYPKGGGGGGDAIFKQRVNTRGRSWAERGPPPPRVCGARRRHRSVLRGAPWQLGREERRDTESGSLLEREQIQPRKQMTEYFALYEKAVLLIRFLGVNKTKNHLLISKEKYLEYFLKFCL